MHQTSALHDEADTEIKMTMAKLLGAEQRGEFLIRECPDTGHQIDISTGERYSSCHDLGEVLCEHDGKTHYRYTRTGGVSLHDGKEHRPVYPIGQATGGRIGRRYR